MKPKRGLVALVALALVISNVGILQAGTTGTLTGTVTDDQTHFPLSHVAIAAVSASGTYDTSTDARGFFALAGVAPDTYVVSFQVAGYESQSISGVNVFADQAATASIALRKTLTTIARVTARSPGGAFQPRQTQDTYTVTAGQIQTDLGKTYATSETQLLATLPGVTIDSSGYPELRGGRSTEEGFEFEGIDYTDAFLHQFVNALALNNPGSLQLTPGAGDATHGNNGTGSINLLTKRGSYPGFGDVQFQLEAKPFDHLLGAEYGFASPDGRVSDYITFTGENRDLTFGPRGTSLAQLGLGAFYGESGDVSRDLIDNFVYRFGRNKNQSIQVLYQNQTNYFPLNAGGITTLNYKTNDAFTIANLRAISAGITGVPLSTAQIQGVIGLLPEQTSVTEALDHVSAASEPNETLKIQYSINPDPSTFITLKAYTVSAVSTFDNAYPSPNLNFTSALSKQGGLRKGFALDATKQVSSSNLVQVGGKFDFLQPVFDYDDNIDGFFAVAGGGFGFDVASFLANDASCPLGPGYCGYLRQFFPGGVRVPYFNAGSNVGRQDLAAYVNDKITPSERLTIDAGLRLDSANYQFPAYNSGLLLPSSVDGSGNPVFTPIPGDAKRPFVLEPRIAASFELTPRDAVRASFGRSVNFVPIGLTNAYTPPGVYSAFANIPSYDALTNAFTGPPQFPTAFSGPGNPYQAQFCGVTSNQPCANFAQQLYWNNQIALNGIPVQPAKPETFSSYEFSYSHEFPHNVAFKITPFYRRGYDALALVATAKTDASGAILVNPDGTPQTNPSVTTNLGVERTTGIEFLLTKEAAYGFSGSLSGTYVNETSNVIPLSGGEDFFPSIPPASLALGNQYRVGFLSPFQATAALQYKTRSGLRINPVISYNRGYPIGQGNLTAIFVNGKPFNVADTNITNSAGSNSAPNYVDPQYPGSVFAPNVVASRGTPEVASAGGILPNAILNTNVTVEYSSPGSHNTVGVLVSNVFGNLFGGPTYNTRYQPVATGISGPLTGLTSTGVSFPGIGIADYGSLLDGRQPYLLFPLGQPTSVRLYYQVNF